MGDGRVDGDLRDIDAGGDDDVIATEGQVLDVGRIRVFIRALEVGDHGVGGDGSVTHPLEGGLVEASVVDGS